MSHFFWRLNDEDYGEWLTYDGQLITPNEQTDFFALKTDDDGQAFESLDAVDFPQSWGEMLPAELYDLPNGGKTFTYGGVTFELVDNVLTPEVTNFFPN